MLNRKSRPFSVISIFHQITFVKVYLTETTWTTAVKLQQFIASLLEWFKCFYTDSIICCKVSSVLKMQLLEHLLMQSHKRKTGSHFLAKREQLYISGPIRGLLKAQQITTFDVFIFWSNIFRSSELSLVDLLENVDNKLDVISITACGYISRIILLYIIQIMEWKYCQ